MTVIMSRVDHSKQSRRLRRGNSVLSRDNNATHKAAIAKQKGIASEESFREAVYMAIDIYNKRAEYDKTIRLRH